MGEIAGLVSRFLTSWGGLGRGTGGLTGWSDWAGIPWDYLILYQTDGMGWDGSLKVVRNGWNMGS